MAAVRVVLPWSTWPMVPMLRCSLLREFTSYARAVRHSAGVVWRQPAALDVLRIGKGEGGDGQVEVGIHGVERSGTMDPMFQVARRAQSRRAHATPRAAGRDRPSRRSRARKPITRGRILRRNDAIRAATRQTRGGPGSNRDSPLVHRGGGACDRSREPAERGRHPSRVRSIASSNGSSSRVTDRRLGSEMVMRQRGGQVSL